MERKNKLMERIVGAYNQIDNSITEIEQGLISLFAEKGITMLCTDDENKDKIFTYFYDYNGILQEMQVKGLYSDGKQIYVAYGHELVRYNEDCLKELDGSEWEPLTFGEILGWFTAINIAEVIDEYVE